MIMPGVQIAALHGVGLDECGLQRMQLAIVLQTFDGGDLFALREAHGRRQDRTGAPSSRTVQAPHDPFTAAVLGAGEVEFFA